MRDELVSTRGYRRPIRLGAAGGIGTPQAVASAFALGASYVLTGTVNEACVESGLAADAKLMLADADIADITMAPAADMFELGVELQVLKRGTMFAPRAKQLYQLYRNYPSLDRDPRRHRRRTRAKVLDMSIAECWETTRAFWMDRDPDQVTKAEADPRHKMALTFRSYLGIIESLGDRWHPGSPPGLPDLVRASHGRLQRLDCGFVPGRAGNAHGYPGCARTFSRALRS